MASNPHKKEETEDVFDILDTEAFTATFVIENRSKSFSWRLLESVEATESTGESSIIRVLWSGEWVCELVLGKLSAQERKTLMEGFLEGCLTRVMHRKGVCDIRIFKVITDENGAHEEVW